MAKKKIETTMAALEDQFFTVFAKDIGGDILEEVGKTPGYIDSGVLSINWVISGRFVGGGFPIGSMAEVFGESASGKSLLGTNLLRGCQTYGGIPVFHDAERAINKDFAIRASHVDPKRLIVTDANTLEKSFNKIHKMIRQTRQVAKVPLEKPLVIVYDSIAVSPSEREYAETTVDLEEISATALKEAGGGAEKPGERARICSGELRKLMPVTSDNHVVILFINQVRQKIGVLWGPKTTTAGGGEALKYYCGTRLEMASQKHIKDERDNIIGVNVKVFNVKSRFTGSFKKVDNVRIFFDRGIDPFGGLLGALRSCGRVESSGGPGNYIIKEPWANGKTIKFKSAQERNDVPYDVLMECPAVVDADSPEQIQYYVDMFGDALNAAQGKLVEEEVK